MFLSLSPSAQLLSISFRFCQGVADRLYRLSFELYAKYFSTSIFLIFVSSFCWQVQYDQYAITVVAFCTVHSNWSGIIGVFHIHMIYRCCVIKQWKHSQCLELALCMNDIASWITSFTQLTRSNDCVFLLGGLRSGCDYFQNPLLFEVADMVSTIILFRFKLYEKVNEGVSICSN